MPISPIGGPGGQIPSVTTPTPSSTQPVTQPVNDTPRPVTPPVDGMLDPVQVDPGILNPIHRPPVIPIIPIVPTVPTDPVPHTATVNAQGVKSFQFAGPGPAGDGKVTFNWDAPKTNTDGSPITNLGGYKLYFGSTPDKFTNVIDVGNSTTLEVTGLPKGQIYATVTDYTTSGVESARSNEAQALVVK